MYICICIYIYIYLYTDHMAEEEDGHYPMYSSDENSTTTGWTDQIKNSCKEHSAQQHKKPSHLHQYQRCPTRFERAGQHVAALDKPLQFPEGVVHFWSGTNV
jgi:hypothetical protein